MRTSAQIALDKLQCIGNGVSNGEDPSWGMIASFWIDYLRFVVVRGQSDIMGFRFSSDSSELSLSAFFAQKDYASFDGEVFREKLSSFCDALVDATALVGMDSSVDRRNHQTSIPNHVRRFLMTNSADVDDAFVNMDSAVKKLRTHCDTNAFDESDLPEIERELNSVSHQLQSFDL